MLWPLPRTVRPTLALLTILGKSHKQKDPFYMFFKI